MNECSAPSEMASPMPMAKPSPSSLAIPVMSVTVNGRFAPPTLATTAYEVIIPSRPPKTMLLM
jgi:hypothetical protein